MIYDDYAPSFINRRHATTIVGWAACGAFIAGVIATTVYGTFWVAEVVTADVSPNGNISTDSAYVSSNVAERVQK